jgi:hypothetical protein
LSFFKIKKEISKEDLEDPMINKKINEIIKTIEEFSDDQREIIKKFKIDMEKFTNERTMESCLQALSLSMQLANTREKLLETYKEYNNLLESELKKMIKEKTKKI